MDIHSKFSLSLRSPVFLSALLLGSISTGTSGISPAQAQVIIPNGLGSAVSDGFCTPSCTITGGSRAEPHSPNLFHSFGQFSIPQGATATLHHDADIGRIFLRVTDGISFLDGQLATDVGGSLGNADLFFLNPQGIVFGPNASLDIGGSFLATTAEQIQFDGESTAFQVQDDHPTLSINVPTGLQLGSSAGSIAVGTEQSPGPGNGLFIDVRDFSVNHDLRSTGLAVPEGKTLILIGQGLNLWGSNLTAAGGRIELASLSNNQAVSLLSSPGGWQINNAPQNQFSDINLYQAASLDVSGDSSGQLQLQGNNVNLLDGSVLLAETLGNGAGGVIEINATTLNLSGSSVVPPTAPFFLPIGTGIFADLALGQAGRGGDIQLIAKTINLQEGAFASTTTFGSGSGGELFIQADILNIKGVGLNGPSALLAAVGPEAAGQGGQIRLEVEKVLIQDGGGVVASTQGKGNAGSILIDANEVSVTGASFLGVSTIQSSSVPFAKGQGGEIQINTSHLQLSGGGEVVAATFSSAQAGRLEINATESVEIVGRSQFTPREGTEPDRSGLFSSAIFGSGEAGDIVINSPSLSVEQGGVISVSNFPSSAGLPPGTGPSGDILITAGEVILDGDAGLNARTQFDADGPGGANINIQANSIAMNNNSFITASAEGTAGGGNITIQTPFLVAVPDTDSDITASANTGDGGNIQISAESILGLAIRPAVPGNGTNDIDASSRAGADGTVSTNGLDSDEELNFDAIPDDPRDATKLMGSACNGPSQVGGQFIITGRGGIAPTPSETRSGLMPLIEFDDALINPLAFTPEAPAASSSQISAHPGSAPSPEPVQPPLAEAQAWTVDDDNQVTLVAGHGALLPQADYSACHAPAQA